MGSGSHQHLWRCTIIIARNGDDVKSQTESDLNAGIVLRQDNPVARSKAAKCGLDIAVRPDWVLPWPSTLFIAPGTCVPWDLICVGMEFLARWDVAAPFWRLGVLARDLGTPAERERTQAIVRDLRVPVYAHELLFVRASEQGQAFISIWCAECDAEPDGGDDRLAFLRALARVKPVFCVLPRLWLADIAQRETSDRIARQRRPVAIGGPLIRVEIAPGRFVRCHEHERAQIVERYRLLQRGRRHGR